VICNVYVLHCSEEIIQVKDRFIISYNIHVSSSDPNFLVSEYLRCFMSNLDSQIRFDRIKTVWHQWGRTVGC